jgi:guanylate kinase
MPDAVFIFIAPPSWEALETRLTKRGTEPIEIINERLAKARNEIMVASSYDYIVINDEIENAVDKIIAIIRAEHARCDRALEGYYKLMEEK